MRSSHINQAVVELISIGKRAKTEEDVRLGFEGVFKNHLPMLGIAYDAKYEVTVSSGRIDALFRHLIIEYKKPGKFSSGKAYNEAVEQVQGYISTLSMENNEDKSLYIAVVLDGKRIGFTRFNIAGEPIIYPLAEINTESIELFLKYAQTLTFKALTAQNILSDFGPQSNITKDFIRSLWQSFSKRTDPRTTMFYVEWRRLFGQVSGFGQNAGPEQSIVKLAHTLEINVNDNHAEFIFVMHTYYSILIKLIAVFILQSAKKKASTFSNPFQSFSIDEQREFIKDIENGSAFRNLGINNFLEGDFFSWYVNEWNLELSQTTGNLLTTLQDYEPSTPSLMPEAVRDLLKNLYEKLLPKQIRHDLGEFYTPDWLAEYTINASSFSDNDKILDPTCGSGTFLVLLIKEKIKRLQDKMPPAALIQHILTHVYGFDLNPLAVISSRTNYLLALGDLLQYAEDNLEIPVYLTDAIHYPQKEASNYVYSLKTNEGTLNLLIPKQIVETGILDNVLSEIESLVIATSEGSFSQAEAKARLQIILISLGVAETSEYIFKLYEEILNLENKKWNRIWCRIIKNYFSTVTLSNFDVIVGNPPWLRWSSLPESYRNSVKSFCISYGLFSKDKFVGGIETDISTMVLYATAEKWLKTGGTLAFLITRTIFKNESSEGFRKFMLPNNSGVFFHVSKVEDFTDLKPFEGAKNKPVLVVLEKGHKPTEYPLPWIVWKRLGKKAIQDDFTLQEAIQETNRTELIAYPLYPNGGPWLTIEKESLQDCLSLIRSNIARTKQNYKARKGICTDRNGIYFGSISARRGSKHIIFHNDPSLSKDDVIPAINALIEKSLVYPIARGREVSSFTWDFNQIYGILPQERMDGLPEELMKLKYKRTFEYFHNFENEQLKLLSMRSSYRRYLLKRKAPCYSCWNVGEYTFAPYKVAWPEITREFKACVISSIVTPYWDEPRLVVPDHKLYFIPVYNEDEAHYLCSFLNSSQVTKVILSYAETTQIGTHVTEYMNIPLFNKSNKLHTKLSQISLSAHNKLLSAQEAQRKVSELLPFLFS